MTAIPSRIAAIVIGTALLIAAAPVAQAHFVLVEPENWMSQDGEGLPEKLGPCGDEGGGTATGTVTAFHPGQTIAVTIDEVIHHPGHYRAALSINDRSEIPAEPEVTSAPGDPCDSAAIQDPPVFPVLVDNALAHTGTFAGPQTFFVTLPTDVTCSHCTLQVLEFMSSHVAPCFYHHCADISIAGEPVSCGDGHLDITEQCDDGNPASNDGCDAACHLECAGATESTLTIGKLATGPGDETFKVRGSLTLPSPPTPSLDPAAHGLRLLVDGSGGALLDASIAGGAGWKVNAAGTKWTYRDPTLTPSAGILTAVVRDQSAVAPGLVTYSVRGKSASVAVAAVDLPLSARVILAPAASECADSSFAGCALNGSASAVKCQ